MPHPQNTPGSTSVFVRPPMRPSGPTVAWAIDQFLAAVDDGSACDRDGRPFSRDAARGLHWHLRGHVSQRLGTRRLRQLGRADVDTLLLELRADGLSTQRLRELALCVRALGDHALERGLIEVNPAEGVTVPDDPPSPLPRTARQADLDERVRRLLRVMTLACLLVASALVGGAL
jgi:hypothetical protein